MSGVAEIEEQLVRARLRQSKIERGNKDVGYRPCCVGCHPTDCVDGCLNSKHLSFHRSTARNRFVFGGNSGGKTILGVSELVIHSTFSQHPFSGIVLPHPANHRVTFESYRMMESYYLPLFKEWMPRSMLV